MGNPELASLMEMNLKKVWSERDSSVRLKVLEILYSNDSELFHVGDHVSGHIAINKSVSQVLLQMPNDFVFSLLKPVIINNNMGKLVWGIGPVGKNPVSKGMDIVIFENNKIKSLYVFLD